LFVPLVGTAPNALHALGLKAFIAHRQDFVHHEDVGIDVDGHGEAEADVHAGGVKLDLGVNEAFELGKIDNVVEESINLTT
jgi:hypothetical protein